jgi:hypothetical protein
MPVVDGVSNEISRTTRPCRVVQSHVTATKGVSQSVWSKSKEMQNGGMRVMEVTLFSTAK